jgi:transposase
MDDRSLYATILGLAAPWEVERVELTEAEHVVHVWVTAREGTRFVCPECGAASPIYDHSERWWRHLDTCQFQTLLHAAGITQAIAAHIVGCRDARGV